MNQLEKLLCRYCQSLNICIFLSAEQPETADAKTDATTEGAEEATEAKEEGKEGTEEAKPSQENEEQSNEEKPQTETTEDSGEVKKEDNNEEENQVSLWQLVSLGEQFKYTFTTHSSLEILCLPVYKLGLE